jgi:hypothetical protein
MSWRVVVLKLKLHRIWLDLKASHNYEVLEVLEVLEVNRYYLFSLTSSDNKFTWMTKKYYYITSRAGRNANNNNYRYNFSSNMDKTKAISHIDILIRKIFYEKISHDVSVD